MLLMFGSHLSTKKSHFALVLGQQKSIKGYKRNYMQAIDTTANKRCTGVDLKADMSTLTKET